MARSRRRRARLGDKLSKPPGGAGVRFRGTFAVNDHCRPNAVASEQPGPRLDCRT